MKIKIAAAGTAAGMMLAFGLAQVPASASTARTSTTGPVVGETVFKNGRWHKFEATYSALPTQIALIEPDGRELADVQWDSWTPTGGLGEATLKDAGGCGCGVPAAVQVGRPRNGHFTRLIVRPQTSANKPMKFWWPAVASKSTRKVWSAS
ncbi:MAG: hypothetical protein ACLPKI_31140 [Streptosporangiaceae bacterium]